MLIYIFETPGMAENTTTYILAYSRQEAVNIYCRRCNETSAHAEKRLKKIINKPGIIKEEYY